MLNAFRSTEYRQLLGKAMRWAMDGSEQEVFGAPAPFAPFFRGKAG